MYLCAQNHDLKRGGTFETAKAGTFHSVTAGTSIPLFTYNNILLVHPCFLSYSLIKKSTVQIKDSALLVLCSIKRVLAFLNLC